MADGRCESCRWWGARNAWSLTDWAEDDGEGRRACALTETYRSGRLDAQGHLDHSPDTLADAAAHASEAVLFTKPDFGCVQWERLAEEAFGE